VQHRVRTGRWITLHPGFIWSAAGKLEYWIDDAFGARRLAVEVDGWAWHSDVDRFAQDRRRQNALVLAGWTVLRFTWHDLMSRPQAVVAEIRAALRDDHGLSAGDDTPCRARHPNRDHRHGPEVVAGD
jgi:hypothetical protein